MYFDDYISETFGDGEMFIEENFEWYKEDDFEKVFDDMRMDDSVTGNGSGSYTFSTYQAKKNVAELIWDEGFLYEIEGVGWSLNDIMEKGPEAVDVIARCLALEYNYSKLRDIFNEKKEELEGKEEE